MNKHLLGLALLAAVALTGVAQAQPAPSASPPAMTMSTPAVPATTFSITGSEAAAIGVGAVAGAMLFHATMIHGLTLVGAVVGGWVGEMYYGHHIAPKSAN